MWWNVAFAATGVTSLTAVEVDVPCRIELVRGPQGQATIDVEPRPEGRAWISLEGGVLQVHGQGAFEGCVVRGTHTGLTRVAAAGAAQVQVDALVEGAEVLGLGASEIEIGAVRSTRFRVDLAGASVLTVHEGSMVTARYRVSGASSLRAAGAKADQVDVTAMAASEAQVRASHRLRARASGGSAIQVEGHATQRDVRTDRTSTVKGT